MNQCCQCCQEQPTDAPRRRFRPIAVLLNLVLAYVLLVLGGGTLINTGHPVAVETGKLMQLVTLVQPTIHWAKANDHDKVAGGLMVLAGGVPVGRLL